MTLKSDVKFEEKLTLSFKNDMKNWQNWQINSISSFIQKSTEKSSLMALKKDPNFEEKLAFYLKNDMVNLNLVNFNLSSGKYENFHFNELLL